MRIVPFIITAFITVVLIVAFNTRMLLPAPLGSLLSPQHGIWQNAEPADADFNATIHVAGLKGTTQVYFDERLVPHVFAANNEDVFFCTGIPARKVSPVANGFPGSCCGWKIERSIRRHVWHNGYT